MADRSGPRREKPTPLYKCNFCRWAHSAGLKVAAGLGKGRKWPLKFFFRRWAILTEIVTKHWRKLLDGKTNLRPHYYFLYKVKNGHTLKDNAQIGHWNCPLQKFHFSRSQNKVKTPSNSKSDLIRSPQTRYSLQLHWNENFCQWSVNAKISWPLHLQMRSVVI